MTKDEIIKALVDMAKYPTVTLPRDSEALRMAADLLSQPERYITDSMKVRQSLEMALESLEYASTGNRRPEIIGPAITAIKEALAREQDGTYVYASSLATAIWRKHYIKESPKFALLDTTEGVLTQIDNMTCGLVRENPAQPEQELVALQYPQPEQELVALQYPQKDIDWQREQQINAQASSPPQRPWVGLTDEELSILGEKFTHPDEGIDEVAFGLEVQRISKEKNT